MKILVTGLSCHRPGTSRRSGISAGVHRLVLTVYKDVKVHINSSTEQQQRWKVYRAQLLEKATQLGVITVGKTGRKGHSNNSLWIYGKMSNGGLALASHFYWTVRRKHQF